MLLLLLLPLVCSAYNYDDQQLTDPDLVGDIFGTQQVQVEDPSRSAPIIQETRCDEIRPCVECSVFKQYWKHFSSAYECYESCKQFSFVTQPGLNISTLISSSLWAWFFSEADSICTFEYSPVCGIDDKQYSNSCAAKNGNGVGVSCEGECPCSSQGIDTGAK